MILTLPIPGFVSVVGLAAFGLPGDRIQLTPGLPSGLVDFALFLFGKLLVGNEFFHNANLLILRGIAWQSPKSKEIAPQAFPSVTTPACGLVRNDT